MDHPWWPFLIWSFSPFTIDATLYRQRSSQINYWQRSRIEPFSLQIRRPRELRLFPRGGVIRICKASRPQLGFELHAPRHLNGYQPETYKGLRFRFLRTSFSPFLQSMTKNHGRGPRSSHPWNKFRLIISKTMRISIFSRSGHSLMGFREQIQAYIKKEKCRASWTKRYKGGLWHREMQPGLSYPFSLRGFRLLLCEFWHDNFPIMTCCWKDSLHP